MGVSTSGADQNNLENAPRTPPESFLTYVARLLKSGRIKSVLKLVHDLNVRPEQFNRWLTGEQIPQVMALRLGEVLSLSLNDTAYLLWVTGHYPNQEQAELAVLEVQHSQIGRSNSAPQPTSTAQDSVVIDLRTIVDTLVLSLQDFIQESQEPGERARAQTLLATAVQVEEITQELSHQLTAPIYSPARESLGVRLVPITEVDKINEYRDEESKWYAVAAALVGVMLGIIQNVITGGEWTPYAWYAFGASGVLSAISGWTAWRYGRKAKQARRQAESREWVAWDVFERGRQ